MKKNSAVAKKKGRRVYVVETDDRLYKFLERYKAEILEQDAIKLGDGPALYKIAVEYFRVRYPELARSAAR